MSNNVVSAMLKVNANPDTVKLDQQLQRHFYELPFTGVHDGMTLEFGVAPAKSMLDESHIVLETDYGYCAIDNHCTLFQALLGVPFSDLSQEELAKKITLFLPSAPSEFTNLFGRITPNVYSKLSPSHYLLRARLITADCSMSFNMIGTEEFWQQVLNHSSVTKKKVVNAAKKEVCPQVGVPLGGVTIGRKALSNLNIGDVLRLDNCLFDMSGQGSVNIGKDTLFVQWQSRGITDNFLITGRESGNAY